MRDFKLAFLSICDNIKMSIIIFLQISIIIMVLNVLIGSINNRTMLSDPYKTALDSKGWFVSYDLSNGENQSETMDKFLSSFEGDPEIIKMGQVSFYNPQIGKAVNIYILSNDVFGNLKLPTTASCNFSEYRLMAFIGNSNLKCGDRFSFTSYSGKNIENVMITDILTDPTYIPYYNQWKKDADILMLYQSISSEQYENINMITDFEGAKKIGLTKDDYILHCGAIVYYPNGIDQETYDRVNHRMQNDIACATIELNDFKKAVEKNINDDYKKYVPLAVVSILIMLIGTVGALAIQILGEIQKYAVFYICGSKWNEIIRINLCKTLILVAGSLMINGAAMLVLQSKSIAANLGLVFNTDNLIASALISILTILSSIVIPFILFRNNQPVEVMRRIKND